MRILQKLKRNQIWFISYSYVPYGLHTKYYILSSVPVPNNKTVGQSIITGGQRSYTYILCMKICLFMYLVHLYKEITWLIKRFCLLFILLCGIKALLYNTTTVITPEYNNTCCTYHHCHHWQYDLINGVVSILTSDTDALGG